MRAIRTDAQASRPAGGSLYFAPCAARRPSGAIARFSKKGHAVTVSFVAVESDQQLESLADLAGEIWREYWPALIGKGQTEYMIEQFQSLPAMQKGIADQGYRYWFIADDEMDDGSDDGGSHAPWGPIVGYTGGYVEPETNRFFISKIYLLQSARGRGYCSKTIAFYEELCRHEGLSAMYLTVNKHNELGIRAYLGKGFETIDAVETDIGEGYVMDDFIMQKEVTPAQQA